MAARACVGMFAFSLAFVSTGAFLMRSGARTDMSLTISESMGCNALPVRARLANYWRVGGALRCPYGQKLSTHGLCVVVFDCLYRQNIAMLVDVLVQVVLGLFAVLPVRASLVKHRCFRLGLLPVRATVGTHK